MSNNKDKKKKSKSFDEAQFKKGISHVESSGGKNLWNKNSSGTGMYQFLYNDIKHLSSMKGVSREQFRDSIPLQEQIMDMAMNNQLKGVPGYHRNAKDLERDYKGALGSKWNYRPDEVAAMSHFLGRQGTRNYLSSVRDGKEYSVSDSKNNKTVDQYLLDYNEGIGSKRGLAPQQPEPLGYSKLNENQFAQGGHAKTNSMKNIYDGGGFLDEFNSGGSHEQNPLGGIPIGIGANGKPNVVEEGETRNGDYIYSDRLTLDEISIAKHNLPKKFKGKTFAEVSKSLNEQLKGNVNNTIDKETTEEMLSRLTQASEEIKQLINPGGGEGANQLAYGGFGSETTNPYDIYGEEGSAKMTTNMEAGDKAAETAFAATGMMGAAIGAVSAFGDKAGQKIKGIGGDWMSAAFRPDKAGREIALNKDASFGDKVGGWLAGTIIPGAGGYLVNKYREKAMNKEAKKSVLGVAAQERGRDVKESNFAAHGGYLNHFGDGGPAGFGYKRKAANDNAYWAGKADDRAFKDSNAFFAGEADKRAKLDGKEDKKGFLDNIKGAGQALRYAPAAMNMFQLATLKKPESETLDRADARYKRNYVDEQTMTNKINNQYGNLNEAIANVGGSGSGLRTNLMAANFNKVRSTSDAMFKATNANRIEDRFGQQFDQRGNIFNIGQSNQQKDINARNRAAYDNNKSMFLGNIGENLGDVGLEELRKTYPERAGLGYNYKGQYFDLLEAEKKRKKEDRAAKKANKKAKRNA